MSLDHNQLRDLIGRTLQFSNLYSKNAVELLMGTAAQESHLGTYLQQIKGPAKGFFQMEPATEQDIWKNYIHYRPHLADAVVKVAWTAMPSSWSLETNIAYQIIMARIHYLRVPHPLPWRKDIKAMAEYWDKYYNRNPDKGFPREFVRAYKKLCVA